jgi:hypothetical protein
VVEGIPADSLRWISSSWTAIWFGGSREQEATASAMMRVRSLVRTRRYRRPRVTG